MRILAMSAMVLAAGCAPAPVRETTDAERSRFLYFAVLEGLWEDGPDPALFKPLLDAPRDHFVPKCPVCTPVSHAFRMYVEMPDVPVFDARGRVFPKELAEKLKSPKRELRLAALEAMVAVYVQRRFERSSMSAAERAGMRLAIEAAKKDGMAQLGADFGLTCPSCSGATKLK